MSEELLSVILISLITFMVICITYVRYAYGYWKRKDVPFLEPTFPYGNNDTLIPKGISIGMISQKFYKQFKKQGDQIGGVYIGVQSYLVLVNPEFVKDVLMRDFQSFTDRGIYMNQKDPLSVHLFSQLGEEWTKTRVKLSTVFTIAKMKTMFETMLDCSRGFRNALETFAEQKTDVDMVEVAACFATDVIGSCVFGIDCNSFKHPDAEFRRMGRKFFNEFGLKDKLNLFLSLYAPKFSQKINIRNVQKDISRFFIKTIEYTVDYREKNDVRRNDLLQLLIDLKNSGANFTMNDLVGQVFIFFIGGFETSSWTITMTLYEISKNEEVQNKVRQEILEVLNKYNDKITYEAVNEMKYLGQIIDETLRLWTPVATLTRVCTKDYKFQDTNITIEKGISVMIPVLGIHHDPEYWPEPLKWDPDRFSEENKQNIRPGTHLPFGDGPRNCIGARFGYLQIKIALTAVISKYRVFLSPKTVTPLGRDPHTFILVTKNKVYLQLEKI